MRLRHLVLVLGIGLAGCATLAPEQPDRGSSDPQVARCERVFQWIDAAVKRVGMGDAAEARVPGFPYLRADRFSASYSGEPMGRAQFAQWVERMEALAQSAREAEIANLPPAERASLEARLIEAGFPARPLAAAARECGLALKANDMADANARARLAAAVRVPDSYEYWLRVAGLYPITTMPFYLGVRGWLSETVRDFDRPLTDVAIRGRLVRYAPAPEPPPLGAAQVAGLLERVSRNPLGVPRFAPQELRALAATFAPAYEIDAADDNDRIGSPALGEDGKPRVEPRDPTVFFGLSFARFGREVLTQLTYTAWFRARPKSGALDLLGGNIDGLVWRVTLSGDGRPLLFDSMHPCGCYHLFFPTPRLAPREQPASAEEPALAPQRLPAISAGDRIMLRVAAGTHYLQRVLVNPPGDRVPRRYALAEQESLRRLSAPGGGSRSFYGPDGIVRGSERAERFLFWPMGVPSAGSMRQWGRHATAFIGKRHFDEPRLIERYFVRMPQ